MILGVDWLGKFRCVIDFRKCSIGIEGKILNLLYIIFKNTNYEIKKCTMVNVARIGNSDEDKIDQIKEYVKEIKVLNDEQKEKALEVMLKHRDVFSEKPGCTNKYEHKLIPNCDIKVKKTYDVPL